jgi:hypothetical protein
VVCCSGYFAGSSSQAKVLYDLPFRQHTLHSIIPTDPPLSSQRYRQLHLSATHVRFEVCERSLQLFFSFSLPRAPAASLFYNPADFTPLVLPIHRAIVEGSYALRLNLLTVKLSGIEACIVKEIMSGASPSVIESCRPGDLILDVKSGFEAMISVAPRPFATGFPRLQDIKVLLSQIHTPDLVLFVQRPK